MTGDRQVQDRAFPRFELDHPLAAQLGFFSAVRHDSSLLLSLLTYSAPFSLGVGYRFIS